ncbi:MAG: hypothetical protein GX371_02515 [Bacteroidales bacterium]|nr:hypothetical protein [Bacteroidales bacterium]
MKKVIVLMSMAALLLTSCLEDGSDHFTEGAYVYIAESGMIPYGVTHTGRLITSSEMLLMDPGSIYGIAYSWQEESGMQELSLSEQAAYKVAILGDPFKLNQQYGLDIADTPPIEEVEDGFVAIPSPSNAEIVQQIYPGFEISMGDNWVFEYGYKAREGDTAVVRFTLNEEESNVENNQAVLDMHLDVEKAGDESKQLETRIEAMALNMASLRSMFQTSNTQDVKVKIKYYRDTGVSGDTRIEPTHQDYVLRYSGE